SLDHQTLRDHYFLNAREEGLQVYVKSIFKLKSLLKSYDIIHCHHQFSALVVILCGSNKKVVLSVLGDISKRSFINRFIYYIVKPFCSVIIFKNKVPKLLPKYVLL